MKPRNDATEFYRGIAAWGPSHRRDFPWRDTTDPWRVLVAEVMLQRSRSSTVAKIYDGFFDRWSDAASLAAAAESEVAAVIKPLGLVKRAASLIELAAEVARIGGVPKNRNDLLRLPGVGKYATNATLAVAFGKRVPTVDGVSARVYQRYFGLPGGRLVSTSRELWDLVDWVTPAEGAVEWNWSVLDFAEEVCLETTPKCKGCPLETRCLYAHARRKR